MKSPEALCNGSNTGKMPHEVGRPRSLDNEPSAVPELEPHQHTVPPHSCSRGGSECGGHRNSLPGSKMTNYLRFLQELAIRYYFYNLRLHVLLGNEIP